MVDPAVRIRDFLQKEVIKTSDDVGNIGDLVTSGAIDSFDMVKLMVFIDKEFGVKISQEDLTEENFSSVSAIAALVMRKRG